MQFCSKHVSFLKKKESFLHEIFSKEVREPCVKAGGDTIRWFVGRRTANTRVFDISLQPYLLYHSVTLACIAVKKASIDIYSKNVHTVTILSI